MITNFYVGNDEITDIYVKEGQDGLFNCDLNLRVLKEKSLLSSNIRDRFFVFPNDLKLKYKRKEFINV